MHESIPEDIDLINLKLPDHLQAPPDAGCAHCGSSRIQAFESYGATGVYAPDGVAECRSEAGVHCIDCGVNSEPEQRPWLREAFQIVAGTSRVGVQREHLVTLTLHFRELVTALFEVPVPKEVN